MKSRQMLSSFWKQLIWWTQKWNRITRIRCSFGQTCWRVKQSRCSTSTYSRFFRSTSTNKTRWITQERSLSKSTTMQITCLKAMWHNPFVPKPWSLEETLLSMLAKTPKRKSMSPFNSLRQPSCKTIASIKLDFNWPASTSSSRNLSKLPSTILRLVSIQRCENVTDWWSRKTLMIQSWDKITHQSWEKWDSMNRLKSNTWRPLVSTTSHLNATKPKSCMKSWTKSRSNRDSSKFCSLSRLVETFIQLEMKIRWTKTRKFWTNCLSNRMLSRKMIQSEIACA